MLYRLLGMVVWKVGKFVLRRKYGSALAPRNLAIGGVVALVLALVAAGAKARGGGSSQLTP